MVLAIFCAGNFGKEIYDTALRINSKSNSWEKIVFVDNYVEERQFYGVEVINFRDIENYDTDNIEFTIANGEPFTREEIFKQLKSKELNVCNLIDPLASISETAQIGEGSIVLNGSIISSDVKIGCNVLIQPQCVIGHDISIGDHSTISSGYRPGGNTKIGSKTFIGMGVTSKENITIGDGVIIGMGAVVFNDIEDEMIALGNPARVVKKNENKKVFV